MTIGDFDSVYSIEELVDLLKRERRTNSQMRASAHTQGDRVEAALRQGREDAFFQILKAIGPLRKAVREQ